MSWRIMWKLQIEIQNMENSEYELPKHILNAAIYCSIDSGDICCILL